MAIKDREKRSGNQGNTEGSIIMNKKQLSLKIFNIALPVIVQMLVSYILMFTDTAFLGQYNKESLSAVQNVINPFFTSLSFFFALANGTTILIAQSLGARKPHRARIYAEVSFFIHFLVGLVYFAFWFFFGRGVLTLIGARGEILELAVVYLFYINLFFLYIGLGMTANSCFEGEGWTFPVMIASIYKSVLNIFLDWVMIFGNLGFPEMGISGAAIATVFSDFTGTILLFFFLPKLKSFKIKVRQILRVPKRFYLRVIRLGLPAGAEFMLWSAGQTGLLAILNMIDPYAAGSFGIVNMLGMMFVQCYTGMGVATTNLVGTATGAKDPQLAKTAGNLSIVYSVLFCLFIGIFVLIFPADILRLFTKDPLYIEELIPLLFIVLITSAPRAVNIISGNAIRGTGNTIWMMNTQIAGTITIILMSLLFVFVLDMGIFGVFLAIGIDETWRGLLNYIKFTWFSFDIKPKTIMAGILDTAE
jgi:putative MATE family efflux protein